jgi:hypothetical protein
MQAHGGRTLLAQRCLDNRAVVPDDLGQHVFVNLTDANALEQFTVEPVI